MVFDPDIDGITVGMVVNDLPEWDAQPKKWT
jgi:hypothetical protein